MSNVEKSKQNEIRGVLCRMVQRDREIPVFIHPTELNFYVDKGSHQEQLTIYNPYEFPIKYQVLTNAAKKLTIHTSSVGLIAAHSYIEVSVQHLQPVQKNILQRDKILITLHDTATNKIIGKRALYAILLPRSTDSDRDDEEIPGFYTPCAASRGKRKSSLEEYKTSCQFHVVLLCIFLIMVLFMPTYHETNETKETVIPNILHVSLGYKIIASFILGLITMAILR